MVVVSARHVGGTRGSGIVSCTGFDTICTAVCNGCNSSTVQLYRHTHHVITPGLVDRPHWSDRTPGQMDGESGW